MEINHFAVEEWMNAHETEAIYNLAETCVDSLTLEELVSIDGTTRPEDFFRRLCPLKLTYGHITGSFAFREQAAALYQTMNADNILMTNGAIGANFLLFYSLIRPGDHMICVHPAYQQLYDVAASFGARVDLLHLKPGNGFVPDIAELKSLVTPTTRLICINNPNNPAGSLMEASLLKEIAAVARSCGAYLLCDEVYRPLWDGDDTLVPSVADIYEQGISTSSMSKTWSLAGLRLGWIAAPKAVLAECMKHRDYVTISCGMLDDALAVHALKNRDRILARSRALIHENLAILDEWIGKEPLVSYIKPHAGTTALLKYDLPVSSTELCTGLLASTGVFLTPGSCFDMEGHVRIGYACATEVLRAGLKRITPYIRSLQP